jgi:low affinity Fe/Cu permease
MRMAVGRGRPSAAAGVPGAAPGAGERASAGGAGRGAWFSRAAASAATAMGSPWAFLVAAAVIAGWALTGPLFRFSDTWQLVVNTGTTVATFLMVFLVQNTQNRDARALHLKLDELLRAQAAARNDLIDVEEATDAHLGALQATYRALGERASPGVPPAPNGAAPAPADADRSLTGGGPPTG